MERQADRMAVYFWLKDMGACDRAKLVFADDPNLCNSDILFITEHLSWMAQEIMNLAANYLDGFELNMFLLDVALAAADEWCWHRASPTDRAHYNALRWVYQPDGNGQYMDDGLPF